MNRKILFNRLVRKHIHNFIVWYLNRCGGAFHSGEYGESGNYVALMSDTKYRDYKNI